MLTRIPWQPTGLLGATPRAPANAFFSFCLIAAATGCAREPTAHPSSSPRDTISPSVVSVTPPPGSANVSVTTEITVTFSEPVVRSSLTASTFFLMARDSAVAGTITATGTVATFRPKSPLPYATRYSAAVTTGITDTAGNQLRSEYRWAFATRLWTLASGSIIRALGFDTTGLYAGGTYPTEDAHRTDAFVAKFDRSGQLQWRALTATPRPGPVVNRIVSIGTVADSAYVLRGEDTTFLGAWDLFLEVYHQGRRLRTNHLFRGGGNVEMALVAGAVLVVSAGALHQVTRQGELIRTARLPGATAIERVAVGSGVYACGTTLARLGDGPQGSFHDMFLAAYDSALSLRWVVQDTDTLDDHGPDCATAKLADVAYLAGHPDPLGPLGGRVTALMAYDANGRRLFSKWIDPGRCALTVYAVADLRGDLYLRTCTRLHKLAPDGRVVWTDSTVGWNGRVIVVGDTLYSSSDTNYVVLHDARSGRRIF